MKWPVESRMGFQARPSLLNADGIEYAIAAEPFVLLPSSGIENLGLAFYVSRERATRCYELCEQNGLEAGIVEG